MISTTAEKARGRNSRSRSGSLRRSSMVIAVIHRKVNPPTAM
jgi:hypothetical protein